MGRVVPGRARRGARGWWRGGAIEGPDGSLAGGRRGVEQCCVGRCRAWARWRGAGPGENAGGRGALYRTRSQGGAGTGKVVRVGVCGGLAENRERRGRLGRGGWACGPGGCGCGWAGGVRGGVPRSGRPGGAAAVGGRLRGGGVRGPGAGVRVPGRAGAQVGAGAVVVGDHRTARGRRVQCDARPADGSGPRPVRGGSGRAAGAAGVARWAGRGRGCRSCSPGTRTAPPCWPTARGMRTRAVSGRCAARRRPGRRAAWSAGATGAWSRWMRCRRRT